MPIFALVDCNNFYASCERVFNPRLEGKPIVVLSNNDGCIIARSNEAKKLKIPMGAPFFQWEKFCVKNHVAVFSSNYELYGDMSRRVMTLLAQEGVDLEIYSIDEAFLKLKDINPQQILEQSLSLRQKIKTETGLPVSIGIANTKTLSKVANYIAKTETSTNIFHLNNQNMSVLDKFPVEKIWGIGTPSAKRLHELNIYTAKDLHNAHPKQIRSMFSVTMEKTVYELRGTSCLTLDLVQPRKQIISSRSFGKPVIQLADLEEAVSHYVATACVKLRNQKSLASGVGVFLQTHLFKENELRYENSHFFHFSTPTADTGYIICIAKKCMQKIYQKGYRYHKAGIILLDLIPESLHQVDLLIQHSVKPDALMQTVDKINQAFGKNTVFHCAEGISRSWQVKRAKRSPRYTTHWDEIVTVTSEFPSLKIRG